MNGDSIQSYLPENNLSRSLKHTSIVPPSVSISDSSFSSKESDIELLNLAIIKWEKKDIRSYRRRGGEGFRLQCFICLPGSAIYSEDGVS